MRWKVWAMIVAWEVVCIYICVFTGPYWRPMAPIAEVAAFFGPFGIYALWLANNITRGDDRTARTLAPETPLRREASSDAPTYPKLADRA